MTPRDLAQRRRVLFTMLTALGFRYPPGREPPISPRLRQWLGGWRGIGVRCGRTPTAAVPWSALEGWLRPP
jgi:hypothetical protein